MKINKILIIISLILCIKLTASAEGLDESNIKNGKRIEFEEAFSILVPNDFELKEIEQDDFLNSKVYEYESKEERIRVIIGSQESTDVRFKDLDYLIRKDLDYKLLTNEQLLLEYESFEQSIADSVPVYMDYLPVSAVSFDERLALVCNAYYTDNESFATGMIKAYRYYYMGNIITLYYDTLIEGNYYNENAFIVFDEIAGSIDFESNPAANVSNPAVLSSIISVSIKPLAVVAAALFIGIALGLLTRSTKGKRVKQNIGEAMVIESSELVESSDIDETYVADENSKVKKQESKVEEPYEETDYSELDSALDYDADEGADWNMLLNQVKTEKSVTEQSELDTEKQEDIDEKSEITVYDDSSENEVNEQIEQAEQIDAKAYNIDGPIDETKPNEKPEVEEQQQEEHKFEHEEHSDYVNELLLKQELLDEQQSKKDRRTALNFDHGFEEFDIDKYDLIEDEDEEDTVKMPKRRLGALVQGIDESLGKKEISQEIGGHEVEEDAYVGDHFSADRQDDDNIDVDEYSDIEIEENDSIIYETLKKESLMDEENTIDNEEYIKTQEPQEEELDYNKEFFASKLVRSKVEKKTDVDTEYIDRMLPEKKKAENKKNIKALQKEVLNFLHDEISEKVEIVSDAEKSKKAKRERKEKLKGASKFLNSIVSRIIGDGDAEDQILSDVESRNELHRKEKIDNTKYDELIPGITDAYEEKEVVDIVMDEYEEIKYLDKEEKEDE